MCHARCRGLFTCICAAILAACCVAFTGACDANRAKVEQQSVQYADRMAWWNQARLGMFIHFGLYSVPAGKWGEKETYGEWIRHEAKIPLDEYEKLKDRFNPAKFDADKVVLAAKGAGMKYITITTKHHDGFCLFDTKETDWSVMHTPFKRDIMKEMADACHRHGLKICWYYSIMDWHHPDYVPRRDWEKDRPTEGAGFDRYVAYMKAQLRELLTNYGEIGVLWFDGQWEGTWNDERGRDLQAFVRSLQPNIIINSRVGRGGGDWGLGSDRLGDYATPEQTIPDKNPGGYWETCMTMNGHWGYCAADKNFKSTTDLVHKTVDIASKGGNFLLNVGPTGEGEIPPESLERLREMGEWIALREESIIGTGASPFEKPFEWGRATTRRIGSATTPERTKIYLHVFEWPESGRLNVPGLLNPPLAAYALGGANQALIPARSENGGVVLSLPAKASSPIDSVIVVDVAGEPDVACAPVITADSEIFIDSLSGAVTTTQKNVQVRVWAAETGHKNTGQALKFDGARFTLDRSAVVFAQAYRNGKAVSPVAQAEYRQVAPRAAVPVGEAQPGLRYLAFETKDDLKLMNEIDLLSPVASGDCADFDVTKRTKERNFALRFTGYIDVPKAGIYRFFTLSDDGSNLWIGDQLVVNNDKPHSSHEESGVIALAQGLHAIRVDFFENWGGFDLKVSWQGPGIAKQPIPAAALVRGAAASKGP